jgi:glucose-1-phosphate adenylyltransferase
VVAVFAADHVYRMDVGQMVCFHEACGAHATVSAARVPIALASSFGVLRTGPEGEILRFEEKPQVPCAIPDDTEHAYVSMGNYLFDPDVLAGLLLAGHRGGSTDFGHDILPRLPGRQRIYAYDFSRNYVPGILIHEERAYWRDVGTLAALQDARNDIREPRPLFNLANAQWPIHGAGLAGRAAPAGRGIASEKASAVPLPLNTGRPAPRPSAV